MTIKVNLNEEQKQWILTTNQQQVQTIKNASQKNAIASDHFVFFAAFDGTNNDLVNKGNEQTTNVAQLWNQYKPNLDFNPNLGGNYYPGPGTKGTLPGSSALPPQVTQQVINQAAKAYKDFVIQASTWLETHPGQSVQVALTSFSRGDASAAIFSQMLYEKGLTDPNNGSILIAPGQIGISAGLLFDPVTTGVESNLAFAPNVKNVVNIRALNEYRQFFKGADYSNQPGLATIGMYGNHSDIGGGYDNGLGALSLQAATVFFQKSGLPIGEVPDERKFDPSDWALHDESFNPNGTDAWSTYFPAGFSTDPDKRLLANPFKPAVASVSDGLPSQTMTLYNGHVLKIISSGTDTERVEETWEQADGSRRKVVTDYSGVAGGSNPIIITDEVFATTDAANTMQNVTARVLVDNDTLSLNFANTLTNKLTLSLAPDVNPDSTTIKLNVADGADTLLTQVSGTSNHGTADFKWTGDGGLQYQFAPSMEGNGSGRGTLTISQGALGSSGQIVINDFDLDKAATDAKGYLGIKFQEQTAIVADRGSDPFAQGDYAPADASTSIQGNLQAITVYASADSDKDQKVALALNGADASQFKVNLGDGFLDFDSGKAVLTIPAGSDSVTVGLLYTGDPTQSPTVQLTSTLLDGEGTADAGSKSNTLTIAYDLSNAPADPVITSTIVGSISYSDDHSTFSTQFDGDGGNDFVQGNNGGKNIVTTHGGDDSITGGDQNDRIKAGEGNNVIAGNGGQDIIYTKDGKNRIYANQKVDLSAALKQGSQGTATGQKGSFISVGNNDNTIVGGNGNDFILTGSGRNLIIRSGHEDGFSISLVLEGVSMRIDKIAAQLCENDAAWKAAA